MNNRKVVRVVAAVIRDGDKIFATQRGYGDFKGKWEFPGGKIEEGETPQEALVREIKEELGIDVSMDELTFLQAIPNSITLPNLIDNEISLVYLYEVKKPIRFSFLDEEVEAVMRVKLSDFEKLVFGEVDHVPCQKHEDGEIIDYYITLSMSQMVPHEMNYFKKVMNKINEYVNNKGRCV